MTIKRRDYDLLDGLSASGGHAYISASEMVDALRLLDQGLVEIWSTAGGFNSWRLTATGRERLTAAKAHGEEIV